ncbi:MAG TPA: PadR family transcriptional regulator [Actinomycetota bacterium]|nr:PadR family transcriptional regulator [Actinomycetota bacterium]
MTTTSYGVLSVLAIGEHSTYELTRQMRRSLHYLWPRAESNVYAEPRRLVEAGLAEAREERTGERRRTVYSITDAGKAALARWLASPSSRQRYESEAVLKVFFAENGTRDDLLASIRALRDESLAAIEHFRGFADLYDAGEGEYPERFDVSALVARLLCEQHAATARWATWAERVVSGWDSASGADAAWGVEILREAGDPFPLDHDPVREALQARPGP